MKDVLAAALFAIAAVQAAASASSDLSGREWVLTALNGEASTGGRPPSIAFTREPFLTSAGFVVSGFAGCNQFTGNYALLPGGAIEIKVRGMTKMACDAPRMTLESEFVAALEAAAFYEWRNDMTLALTSRDGRKQLSFKTASANPG